MPIRRGLRFLGVLHLALLAVSSLSAQSRTAVPSMGVAYDDPVARGAGVLRVYDPVTDTQNAYTVEGLGGFVFGSNGYADLAKAVCFDLPEDHAEVTVHQVDAYLIRSQSPAISEYDVVIWEGAPGFDADQSAGAGPQSELYREAFSIEGIGSFDVPADVHEHPLGTPQTISGPFCVGIQWAASALPADIGIAHTEELAEPSPHEWELWSDGEWHNMSDAWMRNVGWHAWLDVLYADGTTAGEAGAQPQAATLAPIYPNPFADRASVSVEVDAAQRVSVEVFNVLGQRVATLFSGTLQGARTFVLDGAPLDNGLYVVRLQGEDFVQSRKVVLSR